MEDDGHPDPYLDLRPEIAEERRRAARLALERRRQHRETAPCLLSPPAPVAMDGVAPLVSFLDLHPELAEERRRPEPSSSHKTEVEEHASEVSSSEGSVTVDLSESTALALNDMPRTLQSTYWSNLCYDTGSSETESETVAGKPEEESDFDLEKELQEMEDYLQENTCNTISEGMDKILAVERSTLAAKYDNMSAAEYADMTARSSYFSKRLPPLWWLSSPADSETESLQATEQASRNEPSRQCLLRRQPRCEVPDEEIIQNGKNWMTKEVMLAFEKYAERSTNLTDLDWQIEEICHQCFNVEYYHKVFHHYNFTVMIESPRSSDSRVALFFPEVKEIFGRKYYFCCPLEPNENGQCYACHNQGFDDLRHPATGGYD
ncbi:unnamed protein product [Triticum turgidum subsp. durum]|uniref:DUF3615 domain-containing protein n=1 Tax=Triticum turgidum subsp. durum TaxID=4567 RepID=A0A9R1RL13_TRITD|nr:unnamed protein product [Triticum turgidum subsp. durum]